MLVGTPDIASEDLLGLKRYHDLEHEAFEHDPGRWPVVDFGGIHLLCVPRDFEVETDDAEYVIARRCQVMES